MYVCVVMSCMHANIIKIIVIITLKIKEKLIRFIFNAYDDDFKSFSLF